MKEFRSPGSGIQNPLETLKLRVELVSTTPDAYEMIRTTAHNPGTEPGVAISHLGFAIGAD
jgi:hypothetical protein